MPAPLQQLPTVERLPWQTLAVELDREWHPDAPHFSIFAQTRYGKSYFTRHGILPLVTWDQVLILDSKGDDPTWAGCGRPIKRFPRRWDRRVFGEPQPRERWFRLIIPEQRTEAREVVHDALARVYREGHWVVVLDEIRNITDPQDPNLGLKADVEQMYLRGGSRGIMMLSGSQAPRWVPGAAYDQAAHAILGRVRDTEAQKRLLEIGGLSRELLPVIASLSKQRREFMYVGDGGDRVVIFEAPTAPRAPAQRR